MALTFKVSYGFDTEEGAPPISREVFEKVIWGLEDRLKQDVRNLIFWSFASKHLDEFKKAFPFISQLRIAIVDESIGP